jgi:uncharacterized glyoxalase superfamily protein PhnB
MWGDPPQFCISKRDELEIMLNQVDSGDVIHPNSNYDGRFSVYFTVEEVDALFDELRAKGADIVCEPEDQVYGMREFQVRDPDGHLLAFGQLAGGAA